MNREQIIKALECCTDGYCYRGEGCPLVEVGNEDDILVCTSEMAKNALSLIKELTIELDAMRGAANSYKMHYDKVTEENERLRADTVRKMQERLYPLYKVLCVDEGDWRHEIDQIAKEMLEGCYESKC